MKSISVILFAILIFFGSCHKSDIDVWKEKINNLKKPCFMNFELNNDRKEFNFLGEMGTTSLNYLGNYDTILHDDNAIIHTYFTYEDSIFTDSRKLFIDFNRVLNVKSLESFYLDTKNKTYKYEPSLDEILLTFHKGKYRNVLENNLVENRGFIKLVYHVHSNLTYNFYFSNDYKEIPENEAYFEITSIEIIDKCSFYIDGTFSGLGTDYSMEDTVNVENGNMKGFHYNIHNHECEDW